MATTTSYPVIGMTCSHCVTAVTDELRSLPGVRAITIDLVAGGVSRVTVISAAPLPEQDVAAAVEEAGYEMGADDLGRVG